ncbi:hypothetical protein Tco_0128823 [Tanacetum coccineum]
MSLAQRDTLVSLLNVSLQSNATTAPFLSQAPLGREISIDMEQFVQWISEYKLPNDLVMPNNFDMYKGLRDPDLHVWTLRAQLRHVLGTT